MVIRTNFRLFTKNEKYYTKHLYVIAPQEAVLLSMLYHRPPLLTHLSVCAGEAAEQQTLTLKMHCQCQQAHGCVFHWHVV